VFYSQILGSKICTDQGSNPSLPVHIQPVVIPMSYYNPKFIIYNYFFLENASSFNDLWVVPLYWPSMTFRLVLELWCLYQTLVLYCCFCIGCLFFGYYIVPFLLPTSLPPDYERLLELWEEVLNMDHRQRKLEAKLAARGTFWLRPPWFRGQLHLHQLRQ